MTNKKILLLGLTVFMLLLVINIVSAETYEAVYEKIEAREIVEDGETVILAVTVKIYTYNKTNIKHPLKKGLIEYYPDPEKSTLSLEEIKDLLRLYLEIPLNRTRINVSGEGNFSNVSFREIIDRAENITIEIPKCVDETEWGECSIYPPRYCYAGSLVKRCDLCGCPSMQVCQKLSGRCITPPVEGCPSTVSLGDIDGDGIDDTLTNTCAVGWGSNISNNIIAFTTYEGRLGEDLNGDGDTSDYILRYYDITTGDVVNTGAVVGYVGYGGVSISNNIIAFTTYEGRLGEDLNGDGDTSDTILRYYDITTGDVVNTGVDAYGGPSISNNIIAFSTLESRIGEDLNGDGDTSDYILRYYDITTGDVVNTGAVAGYSGVSISNNIIAFLTSDILRYYDITTGDVVNTGTGAHVWSGGPSISNNIIAVITYEGSIVEDLNGDGDTNDKILRYYDITTGDVVNTGAVAWHRGTSISNNIIAFSTLESRIGEDLNGDGDTSDKILRYYDITTDALVNTGVDVWLSGVSISNNIIAFSTLESRIGEDLNGDGDTTDYIVKYITLSKYEAPPSEPIIIKCETGICSETKPHYCDNGNLIDKCSVCGCPEGKECQADESCITPILACEDGTAYGECSSTKPKYCEDGTLVDMCNLCGCPEGKECQADGSCAILPKRVIDTSTKTNLTFTEAENQTVYLKMPKNSVLTNITLALTGFSYLGRYPVEPTLDVGDDGNIEWAYFNVYNVHTEEWVGSCPVGGKYVPGLLMAGRYYGKTVDEFNILIKPNRTIELDRLKLYILFPFSPFDIDGTLSGSICKVATENVASPCSSNPIFLFDNFDLRGLSVGWKTISIESQTTLAKGLWKIMFDSSYSDPNSLPSHNGLGIKICGYSSQGTIFFTNIGGDEYYEGGSPYLEIVAGPFDRTYFISNFANEVNEYLSMCTADTEGNCLVPLVFHSDSAGILQISDINVKYYEEANKCLDETLYDECSATKPLYCDNGVLVDKCSVCGCVEGQECNVNESCTPIPISTCSDGTPYDQCSSTKPLYCDAGNLVDNCQKCSCPSGLVCNSTTGSCYIPIPTCSDGTVYGECSVTKPKYCDNGNLIDKCSVCGCPEGKNCKKDGSCARRKCSDGTAYGKCSTIKPLYCDSGNLIGNCQKCGCPIGQECQADGSCKAIIKEITLNTLSDGSSEKNLTFSSITRDRAAYLEIYKNATVLSAKVDLSGLSTTLIDQSQTSFGWTGVLEGYPYIAQSFTPTQPILSKVAIYLTRFTNYQTPVTLYIKEDINGESIASKTLTSFDFPDEDPRTFHQLSWMIFDFDDIEVNPGDTYYIQLLAKEASEINAEWGFFCSAEDLYPGGRMYGHVACVDLVFRTYSNTTSYPSGLTLDVNEDRTYEWSYSGEFKTTETTPDFLTELNEYLSTCTADAEGNCLVPLVFHSDSAGILQISDINVTYTEKANPDHNPNMIYVRKFFANIWNFIKSIFGG